MALNQPTHYDFLPHYRGDGRRPFSVKLNYKSGDPVDIASARMQLRSPYKDAWEFSTGGDGNTLLTVTGNTINFPILNAWEIDAGSYDYDLEVTDSTGFVTTYLRGTWAVNQDITK